MSYEEKEGLAILMFPPVVGALFLLIGEPLGAVLMGILSAIIWIFAACLWLIGKDIH